MSIRRFISIIIIALTAASSRASVSPDDVSATLRRLDSEISMRDAYLRPKRQAIDSLKSQLRKRRKPAGRLELLEKLGRHYSAYNTDSALFYFNEGFRTATEARNDSMALTFNLRRIALMPLAAFVSESQRMFALIDTTAMSRPMKALYYDTGRQMFNYSAAYYPNYPEQYNAAMNRSNMMQANLIGVLDPDTPAYLLNLGEHFYRQGDPIRARGILTELLERIPETDNLYARACYLMAAMARDRGNNDEYLYYLSRSAIADLRGGTLEISSLQELGRRMFEMSSLERAHNYLRLAHRNAVECGAMLRVIESSESMPLIESAHTIELDQNRRLMTVVLVILLVLLGGLVVALVILRRKIKSLHRMEESLRSANRVREFYISQFLNLCSIYMDKLNQFCKLAQRKISAGQVDELFRLTKSGKFVEEQTDEFYEVFDSAFLHIYPNFISRVNELLRPEERIRLKDGEKLNTDLRILAFMRLGIEESTRIAQVLNYSVYTIYTYRNKLRNRAVNRDTFERDVMEIEG